MRSLIIALVLLAADDNYGLTQEAINSSAISSIEYDNLQFPYATPQLKALSPQARAQAVTALGKVARAYVESAAFKQQYEAWVKNQRPPPPTPKRPYKDLYADKKKEMDDMRAKIDAQMSNIPADQRKQIRDNMEQGLQAQLKMYQDQNMMNQMEEQRFAQEKARYDEAVQRYPEDYRIALKARLQKFLSDTETVDYSAKTTGSGGNTRFVNDTYETRPDIWKRAFRAGKPATDAARAFAKEWLASLK